MRVRFTVDGDVVSLDVDPMSRLLDVLRESASAYGVRAGCGEGECGSCTVLLDGAPVCACLVPICQADGREVKTAAGLTAEGADDAVSSAMLSEAGVQCGACTPGIVVTAHALLERPRPLHRDDATDALAGNLCRCTGYERIVRALLRAAEDPS